MDRISQETLRRVGENDETLTELSIRDYGDGGIFNSTANGDDYSRLGTFIGENTHLTTLNVNVYEGLALKNTNREFFDGLIHNTSISALELDCFIAFRRGNIVGGVAHEILKAYKENNRYLTRLYITFADLQNGGDQVVAATLRNCGNLKHIYINKCTITDEQLFPIVEALRGHDLEKLDFDNNRIGRAGCDALATLLEDGNYNLRVLDLEDNAIDNDGAIALTNSLANNTKLKRLNLIQNPIDTSVHAIFSRLLCNTASINDTYSSNHTLEQLYVTEQHYHQIVPLLTLNEGTNKSHVAIKKILKYHPNIDMEPLFEWNMEGEGERYLKALPYVIAWFDRAREAVANEERGERNNIGERKLSAIYQFAKAMPLLFVPTHHIKGENNKRKRGSV